MANEDWVTSSAILAGLRNEDDSEAWTHFVERFRTPIIGFAMGLGLVASDAEDVAQETLLAFSRGLRDGRYDSSKGRLSRWLFGIAYRQALSHQRDKARNRALVSSPSDATAFWENVPEDHPSTVAWDLEWERMVVARCLDRIRQEVEPVTYRAFELLVYEDKSPNDVAAELEIPVKSVYNAKHRVAKRIRELRDLLEKID